MMTVFSIIPQYNRFLWLTELIVRQVTKNGKKYKKSRYCVHERLSDAAILKYQNCLKNIRSIFIK